MEAYYRELNLTPRASMEEVKASYRRLVKMYHPDAAGGGDAVRFSRIHDAYRSLVGKMKDGPRRPGAPAGDGPPSKSAPRKTWRFEGVTEKDADVIYVLRMSLDAARGGLNLVLPWKAEEACPRCLGVGHTLAPIFGGPHLRKTGCPKCKGQGVVSRNSTVHLDLTPDMIRQGRVRLRGMGRYQPQEGRRGDLVVEFRLELNGKPYSPGLWSA